MSILYEKFKNMKVDTSWVGLAKEEDYGYFCTPVGADIIGWDNGIHYCLLEGLDEMVFAVNPDTCCDEYVYPLAKSFADFIGLVLACKGTNPLQQIILWDKQHYLDFMADPNEVEYAKSPEVATALSALQETLGIAPMAAPFEYVKAVQQDFDYRNIVFSDEYYDATGRERPE